ncbi:zinc finger BED domain-containing protein RICESLEEPER 2-like protein [Tanacetum coccineum]|uniref:Zinc finger BED domain-containing protein RICESLEEPER 2-like protein n=1 Tax=Tanacetum coccineum TaxID=301880 RepID=A0ABQ5E8T2_9ASTR
MLDGQTQLSIQKGDSDDRKMIAWKFDQQSIRRSLAYMLIVDELSFKFVEGKGYKHFLNATQPLFHTPSRITMARDCMKLYLKEKKKVGVLIRGNVGRICLTIDTWTSLQRINYMCLTAHYIDNDWVLRKKVLNFCPISSHRGVDIGKAVEMCLLKWGIESNVFTITVDNASTNDVAVAYLKSKFANWEKSILEGKWLHNSTYLMLDAAQKYERAFARYDSEDRHYRDDLEKTGVTISSDWANVRRLTMFLEHFYELTLKVSGTLYVTSNSFLDDITSIYAALNNCINGVPNANLVLLAKDEECNVLINYGLNHMRHRRHNTMFESVDASSSMNKRSATTTPVIEPSAILKQKVRMEMKRRKSENGLQDSKSEDVLAIPISTVASESVFSTGGRVLDAFRSSLTPPVVESLICTEDWFRKNSMLLDVKIGMRYKRLKRLVKDGSNVV